MPEADASNPERAERILDAAIQLIVHYGYNKTTVSDIARAAHISKGAIYLHWKSKEDLFEALIFREGQRVLEDMLAQVEADPEAGTIFSLFQNGMQALIANPLMHALVTQDTRVMGDFIRRRSKTGLIADSNLFRLEMVQQLQAARVIRADISPELVSYILGFIRYGYLMIHEVIPSEQAPPIEVVGKALAQILDRAFSPEDGGDREAGRRTLEHLLQAMRTMIVNYREVVHGGK